MTTKEELSKDEVFEVLSSSRRRQFLYHLHRRGGHADLQDLARDTATDETGSPVEDDVVKRFYISLYQTHVPKLEELGLVEYDPDEKTVILTDRIEDIARILNTDDSPERQWATYYGILAIAGVLIAIGQLVSLMPPIASLVFAGSLLALSSYHYYETNVKDTEYSFLEQLVTN